MNPLAIYSKTGKGVQEASGKTRDLSRADRAVLAAIDGRSTVAEVAQRLNRSANDAKLLQLFERLERTGFVRLIAGGGASTSQPPSTAPSSRGRSAPPPSKDSTGADLDFTQSISVRRSSTPPADLAALARATADRKAAEEASLKSFSDAARQRAEAEAKARAQREAAQRAAAEAKARDEAAAARAQSEMQQRARREADDKARLEAELLAKIAEAERLAKEAEERGRREAQAKAQEAAARQAREEAERKAKEEAERKAKEEAERQARIEAERKAKEEAERKAKEEAERKAKEEAERKAKEEAERQARIEAERKAKEEAERKAKEEAERKAKEEAERKAKEEAERQAREEAERQAREEAERQAKEEAERQAKEEAERQAREEAERQAKEEAERQAREVAERQAKEEAERQAKEEAERQAKEEAEHQAPDEAAEPAADLSDSLLADLEAFSARDEATREESPREADEVAAREEAEAAAEQRRRDEQEREAEQARRLEAERREPVSRASESPSQPLPDAQERTVGQKAKRRLAAIVATDVVGYSRMMGIDEEGTLTRFKTLVNEIVRPKVEEHGGNIFKTLGDGLLIEFPSVVDAVRWAVEVQTAVANDQAERSLAQRILFRMGVNLGDVIEDDHDIFGDGVNVAARLEASAERGGICISGVVYDQVQDKVSCKFEDLGKQKLKNIARPVRMYRLHGDWETVALRRTTDIGTLPKAAATRVLEDDIEVREEDLDMEDVKHDERALSPRAREEARERGREKKRLARAEEEAPSKVRSRRKWGKPTALTLLVIVVAAVGIAPFVPISPVSYERAASATLGAPVRIGSVHLSLFTGLGLDFERVAIGSDIRIGKAAVTPTIGSLFGGPKVLSRVVLDNVVAHEDALGEVLFGHLHSDRLEVQRVELRKLRLTGPLELPTLDAQLDLAGHALHLARVQGPGNLSMTLRPIGDEVHFDATADSFAPPFAPTLSVTNYAMHGTVTRNGMSVNHFDAQVYGGTLSGTARIRWQNGWSVEGSLKVDGINAGVFAPTLLSQGTAQAKGNFAMIGPNPSKLLGSAHLGGRFSVSQGVLGSFDLAQAIRSKGQNVAGFTRFANMTGSGVYDGGSVTLRNVEISAGALSAGIGADISPSGALSGRIIADVKTADGRTLSTTLNLAGTVTTPRVRGH